MFGWLSKLRIFGSKKNFEASLMILTKEEIKLSVHTFIQSKKTKENMESKYLEILSLISERINEKTKKLDLGSVAQFKFVEEIKELLKEKELPFEKVCVYGIEIIDKVGEEASAQIETLRRKVEEDSIEIHNQYRLGLIKLEDDAKIETQNFFHKLNLERIEWRNQNQANKQNSELFNRYLLAFDYISANNIDQSKNSDNSTIEKAIKILENKTN